MTVLILFALGACVASIPVCPKPLRMVTPEGSTHTIRIPCNIPPPIPTKPPTRPPTTVRPPTSPPTPSGRSTFQTNALKVIKSDDGFLRGCADPLLYVLYARVVPGVRGSTLGRVLPRIDFGSGRCSGNYIRKTGAVTTDIVPTDRVSISAYVVIGIEKDNFGTSTVNRKVSEELDKLKDLVRKLESEDISPVLARIALAIPRLIDSKLEIPEIKKPSDGFLNLGHDFVGFNGLVVVSGSGFDGQPSVCSRDEFPICAAGTIFKGLVVGGKVDKNVWRADVKISSQ